MDDFIEVIIDCDEKTARPKLQHHTNQPISKRIVVPAAHRPHITYLFLNVEFLSFLLEFTFVRFAFFVDPFTHLNFHIVFHLIDYRFVIGQFDYALQRTEAN